MGRAPCCDKGKVKRGPWSPEEDTTLKTYLEKHGTGGNWIALPHKAGLNRCGKSCRLRWLNYLRPDIKHGGFTEEEDRVILTLYSNIGSRWSVIASQMPGRTDNDVKNYWNTKLKKKLLGSNKISFNANSNVSNSGKNMDISEQLPGLVPNIIQGSDQATMACFGANSSTLTLPNVMDGNYGQSTVPQETSYFDSIGHLCYSDGNTSSSVSSALEVSSLGFEDNLASWSGNINYGGVNNEDYGILVECMRFDSSHNGLLSGFGLF